MSLDASQFRIVCGHFATGVAIVTMRNQAGESHGLTANSFTSVSLDPPLILVCVEKSISSYPAMTEAEGFLVNVLTEQQEELAKAARRMTERLQEQVEELVGRVDYIEEAMQLFRRKGA